MAIAVQQTAEISNASSGNFSGNVTAGNTIFLCVMAFNSSNVTISSSSPTFNSSPVTGATQLVSAQSPYSGGDTVYTAIWMLPNVSGGASGVGITVTNGLSSVNSGFYAYEVSGLGANPVLDQKSTGATASGAANSGTTPAILASPELIIAVAREFGGTVTPPGSPWNNLALGTTASGYQIAVSSGGTYTYNCTGVTTGPSSAIIATVAVALPLAGTPVYGRNQPVQARWASNVSGYSITSLTSVGFNPTSGPPVIPLKRPVRAWIPQRPRAGGLVVSNQHTPAYVAPVNPPPPGPAAAPVDSSALPSIITAISW